MDEPRDPEKQPSTSQPNTEGQERAATKQSFDVGTPSRHTTPSMHSSSHGELSTGEPRSEAPASSPSQPDNPPPYSVYTLWQKRLIVLAASLSAFFSPLTAQIYLPALPVLAQDFNVSTSKINLTVTTYMIFQGVTPMFIGGFADTAGRRPAYLVCFVVYIAANIGLALSKNYASVLVVRCLQSAGSSTTVALNQAVVADIITSAERGQYIGITVIPVVLAPSLGPVIGGLLSQYLGWRSIFWFLCIASVVTLIPMLLFFPETCRQIVGDGSIRPPKWHRTFWQLIKDARRRKEARKGRDLERTTTGVSVMSKAPTFKFKTPNPWLSIRLLFRRELALLLFYSGIVFAGFYGIATAMPSQLEAKYGYDDIKIGLMYLPMAGGSIAAAFVVGPGINRNYRRHAMKLGLPVDKLRQMDLSNFPIEAARLQVGIPLLSLCIGVMLCWGWVMDPNRRVSPAAPCVLLFLMGFGMIGFINTVNALIVDLYPQKAGAAVAANNLTRCLLGALMSAVIVPMINAMGSGWAFFLIGAIYVVFLPALWVLYKNGPKWRRETKARDERKLQKKEAKRLAKEKNKATERTEGVGLDGLEQPAEEQPRPEGPKEQGTNA
jgi:multidrug resistance protein